MIGNLQDNLIYDNTITNKRNETYFEDGYYLGEFSIHMYNKIIFHRKLWSMILL